MHIISLTFSVLMVISTASANQVLGLGPYRRRGKLPWNQSHGLDELKRNFANLTMPSCWISLSVGSWKETKLAG
jgi:hypothetical protein